MFALISLDVETLAELALNIVCLITVLTIEDEGIFSMQMWLSFTLSSPCEYELNRQRELYVNYVL